VELIFAISLIQKSSLDIPHFFKKNSLKSRDIVMPILPKKANRIINRYGNGSKGPLFINSQLNNEEIQQKELMELFDQLLIDDREVLLMDIHTTSAEGEIPFIVTNSNSYSIEIALQIGIPVIKEVDKVLKGTTLQYFGVQNMSAFGIEAGQHDDPVSIKRVEAAIWTSLLSAGCMKDHDIPELKEKRNFLRKTSKQVPSLVHFTYRYPVDSSDDYQTLPGFKNFDPITKGQQLAKNNGKAILAPNDGYLLMPLYQKQGEDGFFIVNEG